MKAKSKCFRINQAKQFFTGMHPHINAYDEITIPAKYTVIGRNAFDFSYCGTPRTKRVIIPETVLEIQDYAFRGLRVSDYIEIPESVTEIGRSPFYLGEYAYIKCAPESYAYAYCKINKIKNSVDMAQKGSDHDWLQSIMRGISLAPQSAAQAVIEKKSEAGNKQDTDSSIRMENEQPLEQSAQDAWKKVSRQLSDVQSQMTHFESLAKEIHADVRTIRDLVGSVAECIHEQKKQLPDSHTVSKLSETQLEDIRREFINTTAKEIAGLAYKEGSSVDFEEAFLKGIFGTYWDGLDGYTRRSLVSARVLLTNCSKASYSGLDFSGVVIACTSALENELKLRFFDGYQQYLSEKYGNDLYKWPRSMKYKNGEGTWEIAKNFTLGSMPKIFGSDSRTSDGTSGMVKRESKVILYENEKYNLENYLKTILIRESYDLNAFFKKGISGLSFLDRCEDIRFVYRNAAAHTDAMPKEDAATCCEKVIGITQNNAASGVGCIQGLIYELATLTRIPALNE